MIEIQDVVVPTKGIAKYFNLLALNFPPFPTSVVFYWSIYAQGVVNVDQLGPTDLLLDGNLTMNQETYDNWGTNDEYVINWALNELGFVQV